MWIKFGINIFKNYLCPNYENITYNYFFSIFVYFVFLSWNGVIISKTVERLKKYSRKLPGEKPNGRHVLGEICRRYRIILKWILRRVRTGFMCRVLGSSGERYWTFRIQKDGKLINWTHRLLCESVSWIKCSSRTCGTF